MRKLLPASLLFFLVSGWLRADLLNEAVPAFPAQTSSLEYDSLTALRALPSYRTLRQQYAGEGLQRSQKDLLLLGISEDQLSEVVTAAGPNGFFGLLAGSFRAVPAAVAAAKHGMAQNALDNGTAFCSKDEICFLFPTGEEGRALFGTLAQLRAICDVRQGHAPSLRSNETFVYFFNHRDPNAPVFGFAPGKEIASWIGGSLPESVAAHLDPSQLFSTIEAFGYSVKLDRKAHVALNLICTSETAGTILRDTLSAASNLQKAAASVAGPTAAPFENMLVRSSGRLIDVSLDAPIS